MSYSTAIPGLPGGPLTTDYPIHIGAPDASGNLSFVPIGRQRPGRKAGLPRRSVQHGTGNPDSLARGDASFVRNDPQAAANQESMHFELDDTEVYVLVPLDEVTYQAADGGGPGNEHGFSAEMSENAALWADPTRRARVIHIAADLMGRCAARFGSVPIPERHWDFNWIECCSQPCDVQCGNRHHCPEQLMTRGLWDDYGSQWRAAKADELKRMDQPQPTPTPGPSQATPQSPWRTLGDTTLDVFKAEFARKGSPILAEAEAVYGAVKGSSLLYLAQCGQESEYATTGEGAKTADHNPLGNRNPDGSYRTFPSWAANAAWYVAHVTDPNGPYAPTTSIANYIHVYAPASDGNDEAAYAQFICDYRNKFPAPAPAPAPQPTPTPPPTPQPVYAKPVVPPFLANPAKIPDADQIYNGVVLYRCHRVYKAVVATPVLQTADPAKPTKLRPDVQPGDLFVGEYVFVGQPYQGDGRWVMTTYGSRVPMAGLTPKVDIKP